LQIIDNISIVLGQILTFFYELTGDYAYSIILFAAAIKLSLLYFSNQQYKSMAAMQRLQPEMKKLQDKYKKEQEKLNEKMMELWKVHKVNPLGGCLPLLIQMPILYALYKTISNFQTEFTSAKFLWIGYMPESDIPRIPFNIPFLGENIPLFGSSLASPDLILVIIYGLSMYLSQILTMSSSPQGGNQKTTAIIMTVVITFVMYKFQSALLLYWLVFNILTIIHQQLLKMMDEGKEEIKVDLEEKEIENDLPDTEIKTVGEEEDFSPKITQPLEEGTLSKVTRKFGTESNRKKKRKKKR